MENSAEIPRLRYLEVAPANPAFHAVRAAFPVEGRSEVRLHCHDYYEWMVVLKGAARHVVNGEPAVLRSGDLVLIRPDDCHAIFPSEPFGIEFINVAFPAALWRDFVQATGLQEIARKWDVSKSGVCLELTPDQKQALRTEALSAVHHYHHAPTRLAFSPFWCAAAGAFVEQAGGRNQPLWLKETLRWVQSVDILELSLDTLVKNSGVSFTHLSRTLKAHTGMTATELINETRINRAAYLLAATDAGIAAIAFDCGFENLSYFYRRFRQFHGEAPRSYRHKAKLSVPLAE